MDSKLPPSEISNESIIDEITQNLDKSCLAEDDVLQGKENCNPDNPEVSDGENVKDDLKNLNDPWFIDEEQLKERDSKLSDDEINDLKQESEQVKSKGNFLFQTGKLEEAAQTYTEGLRLCPLKFTKVRAILYANRAAALGSKKETKTIAIDDCSDAIKLDENYVKAYSRRARYYEESDKLDDALSDFKKILTIDPEHTESLSAVKRLEPIVTEKLKTEMLDKLKSLGDLCLKPFGLSTNNFNLQKDESTGGYTVKFNQ
ncbi:hypothetical protein TKK_0007509 [Trichogramma kaykai]|uniref:Tetratricopeptide repeat protein 1 n=1 Tax=Trichogramma kaykai TaxID=54128 RepID=A0ABD2WH75_9HYME